MSRLIMTLVRVCSKIEKMKTIEGLVVVMGVAGCGKSSVGEYLATELGAVFIEADDLHPVANVEKMRQGLALDDNDRRPWLDAIVHRAGVCFATGAACVVSCSALKAIYRDTLRTAHSRVQFVFLDGSHDLILSRMQKREGHFMPTSLLESQFAALESPVAEADAISVSIDQSVEEIVQEALRRLS